MEIEKQSSVPESDDELASFSAALRRSSESLSFADDFSQVLHVFLRQALVVSGASQGALAHRTSATLFEVVAQMGAETRSENSQQLSNPTEDDLTEVWERIAQGNETWERVERVTKAQSDNGSNRVLIGCIPFAVGKEVVGYLQLVSETGDKPDDGALQVVRLLADQMGIVLQFVRLSETQTQSAVAREREKAASELVSELGKVNEVLHASLAQLAGLDDMSKFLGRALAQVGHHCGSTAAHLFRFDPSRNRLQQMMCVRDGQLFVSGRDTDPPEFLAGFDTGITECWQRQLASRGVLAISTIATDPLIWPFSRDWHEKMGHRAIASIALVGGNEQPVGMLGLIYLAPHELTPIQQEQGIALAQQMTLALELIRLAESSREAAMQREQERAVAAERARMAREIHDTMAQNFSGILLQLRAMESAEAREDWKARRMHAEAVTELAQTGLDEARRSLMALRPAELEGRSLADALTLLCHLFQKRSRIPIVVEVPSEVVGMPVGPEIEDELLRIAQEAIANAIKHSGATRILVSLSRAANQAQELCVEDDGRGFDPAAATEGFGLIGIQERAARIGATYHLTSDANGTRVCIQTSETQEVRYV